MVVNFESSKTIDGIFCISAAEIYNLFEAPKSTLTGWIKDGFPESISRGWYPLKDCMNWYIEHKVMTSGNGKDLAELQKLKLVNEVSLKKAQSEMAELKNAISRGDYLERSNIVEELQRFFIVLKRSMQAWPHRIASDVSAYVGPDLVAEVEQELTKSTNEVLEQLSVDGVYSAKK